MMGRCFNRHPLGQILKRWQRLGHSMGDRLPPLPAEQPFPRLIAEANRPRRVNRHHPLAQGIQQPFRSFPPPRDKAAMARTDGPRSRARTRKVPALLSLARASISANKSRPSARISMTGTGSASRAQASRSAMPA